MRRYSSCINLLYHTTSTISHFTAMKPPASWEERYLVVWGVLQAFVIQQDTIRELHGMFVAPAAKKGFNAHFEAWKALRKLRDEAAGHPVGHSNSVMGLAWDTNDWGVLMDVDGESTPVHPYICGRLGRYEDELLEAFGRITDGLQRRLDEAR